MTTIVVGLIHPTRQETIQSWTFDAPQASIRIGRSRRNDITLFSRVVSREHAMLHFDGRTLMLQNLGTNGCYRNDRLVRSPVVSDGDIFRIAKTGPRLRICIEAASSAAGFRPSRQAPHRATSQKPLRSCLSPNETVPRNPISTPAMGLKESWI